MVGEDKVIMSVKELRRVHVIRQTMEKQLTQVKAGTLLGLTTCHIRCLIKRVEQAGDQELAHRGRGKPSTRGSRTSTRPWPCSCASSSRGTLDRCWQPRSWPSVTGLRSATRPCGGGCGSAASCISHGGSGPIGVAGAESSRGTILQLDGSHHDWFEGRGPRCVLMAYIDDANSRVFARFYEYDGTILAMDSFQRHVTRYGIPLAVYADKHTTYQSPAPPTVDEQLAGVTPTSQFGRAMVELGVALIAAHSPQAKGRVSGCSRRCRIAW